MTTITIRPLDRAEWAIFRELRLFALQSAPGVFSSSYDAEAGKSAESWRETINGPGHQVFGLFDDRRLIGITAVFTAREDATGETAILAMPFIYPEFRGRGLSKLLYEVRLAWIGERPQLRRIIVSHRHSNEASGRANQKHGFQLVGRRPRIWPDGVTEDEVFYQILTRSPGGGSEDLGSDSN
jgi:RimJ/RimL family protein N-acetyltransferase